MTHMMKSAEFWADRWLSKKWVDQVEWEKEGRGTVVGFIQAIQADAVKSAKPVLPDDLNEVMNEYADKIVAVALECRKEGKADKLTTEAVFINTKLALVQVSDKARREALEAGECLALQVEMLFEDKDCYLRKHAIDALYYRIEKLRALQSRKPESEG